MARSVGEGGNGRSVGREQVDRLVRARIAEIMSAAGLDSGRIGLEVLWGLPPGFIRAYEQLWRVCDGSEGPSGLGKGGGDGAGGGDAQSRAQEVGVSADPKNKGGGAGGRLTDTEGSRGRMAEVVVRSGGSARRASRGAARGSGAGLSLGPEEGIRLKELIDKRLRQVGREIAEELRKGWGYDVDTGEQVVRLDAGKVTLMRSMEGRGAEGP